MPNRGGACDGRSRPHADQHTAEVGGIQRGGVPEGQERNTCCPAFFEEGEKLCGTELVGERVLCG